MSGRTSETIKLSLSEYLANKCLCTSKKQAQALILAKQVKVDGEYVTSPASLVGEDAKVEIVGVKKYVSRGGLKLEHALIQFSIDASGKNCLDVGSSTGGFSDCLLQSRAARVACVDVNYGQLAWKIRTDVRVDVFERMNIKKATTQELGGPFDIIVIDVSFIGLASLAPKLSEFCKEGTELISLVKPQFEASSSEVLGGKVDDEEVRLRTVEEVKVALLKSGFRIVDFCESPITGEKKHNVEYLIYSVFEDEEH